MCVLSGECGAEQDHEPQPPAAGGLVLLPIVLSFQLGDSIFREPWFAGLFLFVIAGLMVRSIPTYSFKKLKISRKWILPTMLITGAVAVFLINAPWLTLSVIGAVYLGSIPLSIRAHRSLSKGEAGNTG